MTTSCDLVPVGYAYGQMESALTCAMLESAGIVAFPQTRYAASIAWHYMFALGGIAILVPASQQQDAIDLLADFNPTQRLRRGVGRMILAIVIFLLVALPPPPSGYFAVRRSTPRSMVAR